jgi:hypothetical protein
MTMHRDLTRDHVSLRTLADQLAGFMTATPPADFAPLAHIRWRMARECFQHMALDDAAVYSPLSRGDLAAPRWIRASTSCKPGTHLEAFRRYMAKWSGAAVLRDWSGYVAETLSLLDSMKRHAVFEEQHLYPLLAASARRAAAGDNG